MGFYTIRFRVIANMTKIFPKLHITIFYTTHNIIFITLVYGIITNFPANNDPFTILSKYAKEIFECFVEGILYIIDKALINHSYLPRWISFERYIYEIRVATAARLTYK